MSVLGLMIGSLALPSAVATGCDADAQLDAAIPGDRSLSAAATCVVSVENPPASASAGAHVESDGTAIEGGIDNSLDLDGDGKPESEGTNEFGFQCPPPEQQRIVTGIVCPVLTSL